MANDEMNVPENPDKPPRKQDPYVTGEREGCVIAGIGIGIGVALSVAGSVAAYKHMASPPTQPQPIVKINETSVNRTNKPTSLPVDSLNHPANLSVLKPKENVFTVTR